MSTRIEVTPASLITHYLTAQRDAIATTEPGVRAGDADAIHDMRVATRRLRATLRTFRPLFDRARTDPLRAELRWLARLLGDARDGDVLAERLGAAIAAEPPELVIGPVAARVRNRLAADAAQAAQRLAAGLDSDRFAALRRELDAWSRVAVVAGAAGPEPAGRRRLRRRARWALRRADHRLDVAEPTPTPTPATNGENRASGKDSTPGPNDNDRRLHEARKAYKAARYAAEAVEPLGGPPAGKLIKRLKRLQDVLGEHQDTLVARDLLRDHGMRAYGEGDNAFTYGLLHARQRARGEQALAGVGRARRRAGKRGVRRWLNG